MKNFYCYLKNYYSLFLFLPALLFSSYKDASKHKALSKEGIDTSGYQLVLVEIAPGQALSRTWTVLVIEILQPRLESVLVEIAAGLPSRFAARRGRRTMMHCENSLA